MKLQRKKNVPAPFPLPKITSALHYLPYWKLLLTVQPTSDKCKLYSIREISNNEIFIPTLNLSKVTSFFLFPFSFPVKMKLKEVNNQCFT